MNIVLSYPDRYDFNLVVPEPYAQRHMASMRINIDCYRISKQSIDTFLSRVYSHTLERNLKREHLSSDYIWRYADIEINASRKRYYTLALAVCAAPGYLTRRLHYLSGSAAIERTETDLWVAYTPNDDVITADSLFALIQSLSA
jgi:hypothetical protein